MTINFSTAPPKALEELSSTVDSAISQMKRCNGATSVFDKQQFIKKKIQHYERKYIDVKNQPNVEHKFIFGMVLLELYSLFRSTDAKAKSQFKKELLNLLTDCEKYKDEIKHNREAYENRLELSGKKPVESISKEAESDSNLQETSTKEDDSTPSPNPPSVEETSKENLSKVYKNQEITMQEFYQCIKRKEPILLIDYRTSNLQLISKPDPNAKAFSSLKIAELDIENLPKSIMLDDFSQAASPSNIMNTKDYKLVIFMDQTGDLDHVKTSLYTAFTTTSLNPLSDSSVLRLVGGYFNGWIKTMPQYTTDPRPDWNKKFEKQSKTSKNLPKNDDLLTFTESNSNVTAVTSTQSTISRLANDFNNLNLSPESMIYPSINQTHNISTPQAF